MESLNGEKSIIQPKIDFSGDITVNQGAHIFYTYTNEKRYINNAVAFISTGLRLGHAIVLQEDSVRYAKIIDRLIKTGHHKSLLDEEIHFVDKNEFYMVNTVFDCDLILENLTSIIKALLAKRECVRTWGNLLWKEHPELLYKVKRYEEKADKLTKKQNTLSVCAYDGNILSSKAQLELMKSHQYIMTDTELFTSFLYNKNASVPLMPLQENIQESVEELEKYKEVVQRLEKFEIVSQMASSISHEVRNPMTTVRGFLQLLRNKKEYKNDYQYFDLMISELDRANSIITEFLSLGKEKKTHLQVQNLNIIIQNLAPLMNANAVESSKSIRLDLKDIPPIPIDSEEIRQVLLNLVQNGLDAMQGAGEVTISTYIDDDDVVLSVSDQGEGISQEVLGKIGTPFITTKDKGTGLGLATSYAIIERHRATIELKTGENGTTFYIRFAPYL
ncbi:MEDS domain-containing protein [Alkalicella caledoniensis]|uniref:histidine kinase n=1 Tax=Alkalicella caledoniensis TaxID=2731377 RepID=A0A7G9W7N8_ALKCA|nr:MEDS domain-containing protein [Alkalicella caledoniensis]QNO14700.1 MEDS domain-containing protein [Alkalicella caledoniensis]